MGDVTRKKFFPHQSGHTCGLNRVNLPSLRQFINPNEGPFQHGRILSLGHIENAANGDMGNDFLLGRSGKETLHDGEGDDSIIGGAGDDVLIGGKGNDLLMGMAGQDMVKGEEGDDEFWGGTGTFAFLGLVQEDDFQADIIEGGAGADIFHIQGHGWYDYTVFDWPVDYDMTQDHLAPL